MNESKRKEGRKKEGVRCGRKKGGKQGRDVEPI